MHDLLPKTYWLTTLNHICTITLQFTWIKIVDVTHNIWLGQNVLTSKKTFLSPTLVELLLVGDGHAQRRMPFISQTFLNA
jgi:hypothetical protein